MYVFTLFYDNISRIFNMTDISLHVKLIMRISLPYFCVRYILLLNLTTYSQYMQSHSFQNYHQVSRVITGSRLNRLRINLCINIRRLRRIIPDSPEGRLCQHRSGRRSGFLLSFLGILSWWYHLDQLRVVYLLAALIAPRQCILTTRFWSVSAIRCNCFKYGLTNSVLRLPRTRKISGASILTLSSVSSSNPVKTDI